MYTLIAYRGFESLSLRNNKATQSVVLLFREEERTRAFEGFDKTAGMPFWAPAGRMARVHPSLSEITKPISSEYWSLRGDMR